MVFLFMPTISQKEGAIYYLSPGVSKRSVITQLYQQGVIAHPTLFSIYVFFTPQSKLKSGEYFFSHGRNFISIWHQITTGTGFYYRPFILVPGWTFNEFERALQKNPWIKKTIQPNDKEKIMQRLGFANFSPEGMLFPDTYFFTRGESDVDLMTRATKLMQKKLTAVWNQRDEHLPYQTPYEVLIAASMIEKEAFLNKERPLIASVLVNRLKNNIPLQIDATVIYALGDQYDGKIYKKDLHTSSPYNTYMNKGLPPTPIAFPSLASISAVCHPEVTDYYYYVAKGDGSHQFSKTFNEHESAVQEVKLK